MLDRLTSMAVFVKVANKGSFAAAAAGLGMTPAMVGKHIRFLEDRVGAVLVSRTTRRQAITDEGRQFLAKAQTILAEVEQAESFLDEARITPRGLLRVTAPASFGEVLSAALVDYNSLVPEVCIDLIVSDSVVDLAGEGIDVAFRTGRLPDSGLIARPLEPYRFVLCAAPSYIERFGSPQHPEDLRHHKCLAFAGWMDGQPWTFKRGDHEETRILVSSRLRINNRSALRAAAMAGGGIILQSMPSLASAIEDGSLVRLLPEWEHPSRPFHLIWLPDRHDSPRLRSFVNFAADRFGATARKRR